MVCDLISIVVTAFNTEDFLSECINSIRNQSYSNLEVILVDNGSTDGTSKMMDYYKERDNRVKVIHKKYGTPYSGRKAGVMLATGKYLGFVDSDDYIDEDMYEKLSETIEGYDIVTSGYKKEIAGKMYEFFDTLPFGSYKSETEMNYLMEHMILLPYTDKEGIKGRVSDKLFRTDILKTVCTEIEESGFPDDSAIAYSYISKCKNVFVSDICGYTYRVNPLSVTHAYYDNYLSDLNIFYKNMLFIFSKNKKSKALVRQLEEFVSILLSDAGSRMNFGLYSRAKKYIFPFINILDDKKIVLYGSGDVGQDYYSQIQKLKMCNIVLWVSKNRKVLQGSNLELSPLSSLLSEQFDYVIIAVSRKDMALDIKKELVEMGVKDNKILWLPPIYMTDL